MRYCPHIGKPRKVGDDGVLHRNLGFHGCHLLSLCSLPLLNAGAVCNHPRVLMYKHHPTRECLVVCSYGRGIGHSFHS